MGLELLEQSRIAILGNCSGELRDNQGTTSYLVDETMAIDVGTGLMGISTAQTAKIDNIILSHQHFDHICSLPLLINTHYDRYVKKPLQVWSHPETLSALKRNIFNNEIWPDFSAIPSQAEGVLRFNPIEHFQPTQVAGLEVTLIPVVHAVLSSAVAIRSRTGGVIYSSDTTVNDQLWDFLNKNESFHTLFVECTFTNSEREMAVHTTHYCPDLLRDDLLKLNRHIDVYLSHSPNPIKKKILDELQLAVKQGGNCALTTLPSHPKVGHYYQV